jgi:DNA-binding winged helix-turn-helix (wHTH) protein/tetratricopeptide (TPR) repeat protein
MSDGPAGCTHRFGDVLYDARTGELQKGTRKTRLSPHLANLLEALIEHPGELVTRETLRARIWPADTFVDFEHGLTAAVNKLREALGDSVHQPAFVETIPRRGYRWLTPVEMVQPEPSHLPNAMVTPPPADDVPAPLAGPPSGSGDASSQPTAVPAARGRARSRRWPRLAAAVFFVVLAAVAWVWSRPSGRSSQSPPPGVRAPDAANASSDPVSSKASDAYLRGRSFRSSRSPVEWRQSVEYFTRAIDLAPGFARAHAALAQAYATGAAYGFIAPGEALPRARSGALEALRLDDSLADAHVALGDVRLLFEWDWEAAEAAYRRALKAEPDNDTPPQHLAWLLAKAGMFDEAIELLRSLLERDPVDNSVAAGLAAAYIDARRFDAALDVLRRQEARRLGEGGPRWRVALSVACAASRQCDSAIREADRAMAVLDTSEDEVTLVAVGWVYATCGRPDRARELLTRYDDPSRLVRPDPISLAVLYGALGDTAHGLALVERGVTERSPVAVCLDVDLMFDPFRSDPTFERLAARVRGSRPAPTPRRPK